jgi:2-polyprenyl-3-methyl-5-hydroxy-6-metoxy-1,4-benzoquinol methylase
LLNPSSEAQVVGRLNAAEQLLAQGRPFDAVEALLGGLKAQPRDFRLRRALAGALNGLPLDSAGPAVRGVLLDLCLDENIAAQSLVDAVIGLARNTPPFPALLRASIARKDLLAAEPAAVKAFAADSLLTTLLARAVINDPDLERVLTQLRHGLVARGAPIEGVPFEFACALARQCFNTEYAFFVDDDESKAPRPPLADADPRELEHRLVLAALHAPLHRLPEWERLLQWAPENLSDAFRPLWEEQVLNFQKEKEIAASLESLTPIKNETSQAVRHQYEESPYPRWFTIHRPPPVPAQGPRSILIAGGGTGQHPIQVALANPDSAVMALDLSRASLAYAKRMADRCGAKNLEFRQADILELGSWDRKFDRIESLGVLHHMKDPVAGWRVLTELLSEGGTMRIGLYSTRARAPLEEARKLIATAGFPGTPEGIRRARRAILDLPENHPARSVAYSDDFYSASGCRDLIMHVQEHTFTLPQIAHCLRELGLQLHSLQCPPEVNAAFRATYPAPAAVTDLSLWDKFEQQHPEIFRGMYQFSCGRRSQTA